MVVVTVPVAWPVRVLELIAATGYERAKETSVSNKGMEKW
jgi:hypothetical protein